VIIALLAAGAMGNLIDRIRLGYVIDFISVGSFPVFNFADSFITVAIFLLLLFYDKIKRPT
jgi:signal peptidase II